MSEYTPDEQDLEIAWIEKSEADSVNDAAEEFERGIDRIKRDAAREALDGLAREAAGVAEAAPEHNNPWVARVVQGWADEYRNTHYPAEEES